MDNPRIAVLLTCHNRRDTTLACLETLMRQESIDNFRLDVYLVDDGSTDGTAAMVAARYPDIKILQGDGNLYWCGGMRLAFGEARKEDYDYYIWSNDDTMLAPHAIQTVLDTARLVKEQQGHEVIIIGSSQDANTRQHSYGGLNRKNFLFSLHFVPVKPADKPLPCDTMQGNFVLIPRDIAESLGNLSESFTHGIGDVDYGLRAGKHAFSCWIAPGYLATCSRKPLRGSLRDATLPMDERLQKMRSKTGLSPVREWVRYALRHGGLFWPFECFLGLLVRVCFPRLWLLWRGKRPK